MLVWSFQLLWRALILRCPKCGKGKLYRHLYTMYDACPVCGWRFEREQGYWTGAMAVNLVITEFLIAFAVVPLALIGVPAAPLLIVGIPVTIALPFVFYRHSKSFWMGIDFLLNPTKEMFQD